MGFKVTIKNDKLKELQRKARALNGERKVPLSEMMPGAFMQKYTDFETLQAMLDESGIKDPEEIRGEEFSKFVATHTRFDSWGEMLKRAGVEYGKSQLGL